MIKSTTNQNMDIVTTNLKKYDLCWEEGDFVLGGLGFCSLERESWDGKEEEKIREERVGKVMIYSLLSMDRRTHFVGDSISNCDGELVTSLHGDPGLNPLVILSVKSLVKSSTSANCLFLKKNYEYSVCNSIGIYWPQYFVGIYQLNYGWNSIHR